jgi:hypothetical protein
MAHKMPARVDRSHSFVVRAGLGKKATRSLSCKATRVAFRDRFRSQYVQSGAGFFNGIRCKKEQTLPPYIMSVRTAQLRLCDTQDRQEVHRTSFLGSE